MPWRWAPVHCYVASHKWTLTGLPSCLHSHFGWRLQKRVPGVSQVSWAFWSQVSNFKCNETWSFCNAFGSEFLPVQTTWKGLCIVSFFLEKRRRRRESSAPCWNKAPCVHFFAVYSEKNSVMSCLKSIATS